MFGNSNGGGSNGGGSNGGSSNGGGSNGGDVSSLTGLQAYAGDVVSPILMRGLSTTRGLLLQVESAKSVDGEMLPKMPAPGSTDATVRWFACISEFMEGLTWTLSDPGSPQAKVDLADNHKGSKVPAFQVSAPSVFRNKVGLTYADELKAVHALASFRDERLAEINTQIVIPWSYFAMILDLQPSKHRHTLELMQALFFCGKSVVLRMKNHFNCRRPVDVDPSVMPIIATPPHSSYPAGHATEGTLVMSVLQALTAEKKPLAKSRLAILAKRIAENRIVAGLHYPVDNEAGETVGRWLSDYVVKSLTKESGSVWSWLWIEAQKEWRKE